MKITLDIPDNTLCAFFDFVYRDCFGLTMQGHSIQKDELYDGAVITINAKKGGDR
jgi:hypothetical protein